jgi:hypothetical protein
MPIILALGPKKSLHIKREPPPKTPISINVISFPIYFEKIESYTLKYEAILIEL